MRLTFNVLHEPWIPMANGERHSLLSALENAAALPGVLCASPLETCAVYRLMIAFAMDALQLRDRDERTALLKRGAFDMRPFREYIERCESEGASFDLFDARRPFMQSAYDAQVDGEEKRRSAAEIVLDMPSGNNHVFFDHQPSAILRPGDALCHLLSAYLFCTAAAQGYPSSVNNTPCVYVLHRGKTLFDTLVLNMLSVAECGNIAYGRPAWRAEAQVKPKEEFANVDMLQALTWRPRRVTLICGEEGLVSELYLQQGHNFKGNALWRDPHVPYRCQKSGEYASLKPQRGRAFWRDMGSLAASREDRYGRPPLVVANTPKGLPNYDLFLTGLITDNAALVDMVEEEMLLPRDVLDDGERGDILREDLQFLENCAAALRRAADSAGKGGRSDQKSFLAPILQNTFFQIAHDYILGPYLEALTGCESEEDYLRQRGDVHEEVLRMLLRTLDKERLRLGDDAQNLQKQARVRQIVMAGYSKERKKREDEWK